VSPTRDFVSLGALTDGFTRRSSLRARPPFTRPCHSFWSAYAELIRDQLSPTDFCNCTYNVRATKPCNDRLLILAGTETLISFLFLNMPRPCLATRVTCGEPRFVRSCRPQCWFVSVTRVCPTVMPTRSPHHRTTFIAWCVVRIDVHGSKDRAKDASPNDMRRSLVHVLGAYALWRMLTKFPSSAPFWTFAVAGA